jgi:hypothetical protein
MDTGSGRIYQRPFDDAAIAEAEARGATIVPVSQRVADLVKAGEQALNRRERRAQAKEDRRAARRAARGVNQP